jgi:surface antigen
LIKRDIISTSIQKNKKTMQKSKNNRRRQLLKVSSNKARRFSAVFVVALMLMVGTVPRLVHAVSCSSAASCQAQINSLNSQSSQDKQSVSSLQSEAQSYQSTISSLNAQVSGLESQINSNEAQQVSLQSQITNDEQEIVTKKATLSDDLTTMYVNGQMTTIEELATSKNLSDYADRQEYETVVQNQLTDMVQQVTTLESSLQTEKTQVDQLVANEQTQNTQLSDAESQEQQLLSYNQSQQADYNQQIASASSNVSSLKATLTALNTVTGSTEITGGTCGGGYPTSTKSSTSGANWGCNLPQDNTTDNWNMDNRECVSYTAFMVSTKYGISTANWGNAYQWVTAAENHGYTVDQTPTAGSIAIRGRDYSVAGDVGHAMYVDAVNGDGTITVNEYNEHYNGTFDERTFSPDSYDSRGGIYYIHFN